MKKYVVMIDYGDYEGWKIQGDTNDLDEAITMRESVLHYGNEVAIFQRVQLITKAA